MSSAYQSAVACRRLVASPVLVASKDAERRLADEMLVDRVCDTRPPKGDAHYECVEARDRLHRPDRRRPAAAPDLGGGCRTDCRSRALDPERFGRRWQAAQTLCLGEAAEGHRFVRLRQVG